MNYTMFHCTIVTKNAFYVFYNIKIKDELEIQFLLRLRIILTTRSEKQKVIFLENVKKKINNF